jgi:DNA-binding CsgD family transcriptional regulator
LAYFETVNGMHTDGSLAKSAAEAATASGDLEAQIVSETALGMLDLQEGYALRAIKRMDDVQRLTRTGEPTLGHIIAEVHRVRLVVTLGRLEDAAAQVDECTQQARSDGYAMALPPWAILGGMVHAAAGQLAAARATIEALPEREWGSITENNMMRMLVLSDVAVRTDDRNLLQTLVGEARALYSSASPLVSGGAAYVIALAAWHRGDTHEAVRWLSGQHAQITTPLWINVFDQLILLSRVASAGGDAASRARVLQSIEILERERSGTPLFAAVAQHTRGILERDPEALLEAANALRTWRPLLHAGAAEDAGGELARAQRNEEAIEHLNAAFDTFVKCEAVADARRVGRTLRRLGVERRIIVPARGKSGWDSLTDAELKVVNMIAEGATNREVAEQLYLSPHTVKNHVRNAFTKLGINSRSQLPCTTSGYDAR